MKRLCLKDLLFIEGFDKDSVVDLGDEFLVESEGCVWVCGKDYEGVEPEFEKAFGWRIDRFELENNRLSESDVIALSDDLDRARDIEDDMDASYVDDDIYADYSVSEVYEVKHYEEEGLLCGLKKLELSL